MKKLIFSIAFVAIALAVQAGDSKTCAKTACTATKTTDASACCSSMKVTSCKSTQTRVTVMSPKGAEQAVKLVASR